VVKLKIAKIKELRGEIIRKLYDCYGAPVVISNINTMLSYKGYHQREDIKKALMYLSGVKKEFVEITINENDYWASFIQLTPAGVNLAEGDISDMGVLLHG